MKIKSKANFFILQGSGGFWKFPHRSGLKCGCSLFSFASPLPDDSPCFDICRQQGVPSICYPFGPIAEWSHQCCHRDDRPIKMEPSGSFITSRNRWLIRLNQNWSASLQFQKLPNHPSFAKKSLFFLMSSLSWQIKILKKCAESLWHFWGFDKLENSSDLKSTWKGWARGNRKIL